MNKYILLYWDADALPADAPLAFACDADDTEHAEEQCENAYPGCVIAWTGHGMTLEEVYADYWGTP